MRNTILFGVFVLLLFVTIFAHQTEAGTFVQSKGNSAAGATTVTTIFDAAPTSGNLLVAVGATNLAVGFNIPAGWSIAISESITLPSQAIFYKVSNGTETSITLTSVAIADVLGLHIYEFSGQGVIGSVSTNSETGLTTALDQTVTSGVITTGTTNQITIGAFVAAGGFGGYENTWGGSFTETEDFGNTSGRLSGGLNLVNSISSNLEATTALIGAGSGVTWRGQIVSFQEAAATYLKLTGTATMDAGDSNELTITAYNSGNAVDTSYSGTKTLTFSGLANAPDGTVPTIEGINQGTSTSITFTNGVSTVNTGTLIAYLAETASVDVSDGNIDSTGDLSYDLDLVVSPADADATDTSISAAPDPATVDSSVSITVTAKDQYQNPLTTGGDTVVINIAGSNTATPTVTDVGDGTYTASYTPTNSGTDDVTATINTSAVGSDTDGTSDGTYALTVNTAVPGAATYLKLTGTATMDAGDSNELTITAYNSGNAVDTSYSGTKTLTFSGLANAPDGTVPTIEGINQGTSTSITFTNGVSTVNTGTLIAYLAETASVDVSDGNIDSTGDLSYDLDLVVSPADADNIVFSGQPTNAKVSTNITPAIAVQIRDTYNNIVISDTSTVTISISSNPVSGILSGTTGINIGTNPVNGTLSGNTGNGGVAGVATFSNLSINESGSGYRLSAARTGLTSVVSNAFNITTPSTGGGGGGGGGGIVLRITNLQSTTLSPTSLEITWNTNRFATGFVAYGPTSVTIPISSKENYGYTEITTESSMGTKTHRAVIQGLTPGTTYYFIPIAKGKVLQAQGEELSFTPKKEVIEIPEKSPKKEVIEIPEKSPKKDSKKVCRTIKPKLRIRLNSDTTQEQAKERVVCYNTGTTSSQTNVVSRPLIRIRLK